jgi:hypothetical protein
VDPKKGPEKPNSVILVAKATRSGTYEVGENKTYTQLGQIPWARLKAGATVRIHWREKPYHEKILLSTRGTAQKPIRLVGVPGPKGQLPVIDGANATTAKTIDYSYQGTQDRGLVIIGPAKGYKWGFKPGHIRIERLELRNAAPPHKFTDSQARTRAYSANAAALFVERGEQIVVRNCSITGSANGLFVASGDSKEMQSGEILVEGCHIFGNGTRGKDQEHNIYTESRGIAFQYNRLGRLREGALGANLKDRSAGTVIRYNWIEGGAHLLDLVDAQESAKLATADPSYHQTLVYGNVLIDGPGDATLIVHYGGDSSLTRNYRKGTLYFYNNTILIRADQTGKKGRWRTIVLQLETNDEVADIRNNIIFCQAATAGATPTELTLMNLAGQANFGVNWVSPNWVLSRTGLPFKGAVKGTKHFLGGGKNNPGFVDLGKGDLRLSAGSPCVGKGGALATKIAKTHPLTRQYEAPQSGKTRPRKAVDLGAFEKAKKSAD